MMLGINLPAPEMGAFLQFVLSAVAGGGILLLALKIYLAGQEVFGRKPAINVEFEAVGKRHSDLERKMEHCATREDLERVETELIVKIERSVSIEAFNDYKVERKEDFARLELSIKDLVRTVGDYSRMSYEGRKALHKQCNSYGEALSYLAGVVDKGGTKVRDLIRKGREEELSREGGDLA